MTVGAVSAISGSSRQIIWKASEPVSDRVRPEPGWLRYIIAVSDQPACVVKFTSRRLQLPPLIPSAAGGDYAKIMCYFDKA